MTIQEILEAHKSYRTYLDSSDKAKVSCSCGIKDIRRVGKLADGSHRAHVAEVLEQHMREREADAWDRAKAAVRGIPFWTDGTNHGFDMCEDEEGLSHETGARMAVMRILDNNFYRMESHDGR